MVKGSGELGKWGGEGFSGNLPITLNLYCLLHSASDEVRYPGDNGFKTHVF